MIREENAPLLSIIVPCYNIETYIEHCLNSVKNQTFSHFECIIVDDGSADHTLERVEVCVGKDSRFVVLHHENSGVSHSRNVGLAKARGKYVHFLDGDDWVEAYTYETVLLCMEDDVDMVSFGYDELDAEGEIQRENRCKHIETTSSSEFLKLLFLKKRRQHICSFVIKRSILTEEKLLFDETLDFGEDQVFQVSAIAACKNKILCLPDVLFHYCQRMNSAVNRNANLRKLDSLRIYDSLTEKFEMQHLLPHYNNFVAMQFFGLLKDGVRTNADQSYFDEMDRFRFYLHRSTFGWNKFEAMSFILSIMYLVSPSLTRSLLGYFKNTKV